MRLRRGAITMGAKRLSPGFFLLSIFAVGLALSSADGQVGGGGFAVPPKAQAAAEPADARPYAPAQAWDAVENRRTSIHRHTPTHPLSQKPVPQTYVANVTVSSPSGTRAAILECNGHVQRQRLLVLAPDGAPGLYVLICADLQHTYNWTRAPGSCRGGWGALGGSVDMFSFVGDADADFGGACSAGGGRAGNRWGLDDAVSACVTPDGVPLWIEFGTVGIGYNFTDFAAGVAPDPTDLMLPDDCANTLPAHAPYGLQDDFEAGGLAAFWLPPGPEYERWVAGHITVQSRVVRHGRYAANVTVVAGDVRVGDSERDELDSRPWPLLGDEVFYGWSQLLPEDFPIVDDRLVMGQLKQAGLGDVRAAAACLCARAQTVAHATLYALTRRPPRAQISPLWAQRFINGRWYFTVLTENNSSNSHVFDTNATYPLGVWNDMVVGVKYTRADDGWLRVWHNGTQLVDYRGPTAHADEGNDAFYFKWGLYRDNWPTPWTAYFDTFSVGSSRSAVDPARFDPPRAHGVHTV